MRLPFKIIHEDEDVLVIDKPAGLLTSTGPRERRTTVLALVTDYLEHESRDARVGLIHRLDRDASGLLVFSKCAPAYHSLKQQFFDHTVSRIYYAIVRGEITPRDGRIESRLIEYVDGSVHSTPKPHAGQPAITEYKSISTRNDLSLLRIKLHTGRKHQIRAHLSERGVAILNDPLYTTDPPQGRLMLAATELTFDHPRSGKRMKFEIDLPKEMRELMRDVKRD